MMFLQLPNSLPSIVQKITCLFENDTTEPNYQYIEYLPDGRGFTFGKVGFTTATGDGYDVIKAYTDINKNSGLVFYLDELKKLANKESDDTTNLVGFSTTFKNEALQTAFFQDKIAFELYGLPAINYCQKLGLTSNLALSIVYDAIVQHGDGKDDDGIRKIFKHTIKEIEGSPSGKTHKDKTCKKIIKEAEVKFLHMFLCVRRGILEDANNKDTRHEWEQSVERVDVFMKLLNAGNMELNTPLTIESEDWNTVIE
jgi:chitosanase